VPHFEAARLRSLPATNATRRRCHSVASPVPLHDCPPDGSHCEAHHRRSTPSTRLRHPSECHELGKCTSPATRSSASADRVPGASLPPMDCLFVPADLRTIVPLHLRCAVASPTAIHGCNPAPPNARQPAALRASAESSTPAVLFHLRSGQRLRSCLTAATPSAPAPQPVFRSHTATVTTPSQLVSDSDTRQLPKARGDPGPTAYAHNLALCRMARRIPSAHFVSFDITEIVSLQPPDRLGHQSTADAPAFATLISLQSPRLLPFGDYSLSPGPHPGRS